jgi:glycosyltransferase involved in cell wall biosynthesis
MKRSASRNLFALGSSLFSRQPFLITRDWVSEMASIIQYEIKNSNFDFIHADQLWMTNYALQAKRHRPKPNFILDQHNAVHLIPQRLAPNTHNPIRKLLLQRESNLMANYEVQTCRQFDRVVWVTKEDYKAVRSLKSPGLSTIDRVQNSRSANRRPPSEIRNSIIPICIDPSEVTPINPVTHEPNILFLGGMHWPPNAEGISWFIEQVLPIIRAKVPNAKLFVVGKSPPNAALNAQGVVAPGFVESVEEYWCMSRVFIVPLLSGGGMRVKILDAWAHRLPVVSTTIGAEGISNSDSVNILVADDPQSFALGVVELFQDNDIAHTLAENGRRTVERHYDWRLVYKAWDQVYQTG